MTRTPVMMIMPVTDATSDDKIEKSLPPGPGGTAPAGGVTDAAAARPRAGRVGVGGIYPTPVTVTDSVGPGPRAHSLD